jgi:hypothetical protein
MSAIVDGIWQRGCAWRKAIRRRLRQQNADWETLARSRRSTSSPRRREKVRSAERFLSAIDPCDCAQVAVVPRRRDSWSVATAVFVLAAAALCSEEARLRERPGPGASTKRGKRPSRGALTRELEQSRAAVAETRQAERSGPR